jgi:hypothetical protein
MLTVSPNPATESANLSFVSSVNGTPEVQLLDMTGHSCWHQQYAVSAGANTLPLEGLQSLRTGIYLLQYNDGQRDKAGKTAGETLAVSDRWMSARGGAQWNKSFRGIRQNG